MPKGDVRAAANRAARGGDNQRDVALKTLPYSSIFVVTLERQRILAILGGKPLEAGYIGGVENFSYKLT